MISITHGQWLFEGWIFACRLGGLIICTKHNETHDVFYIVIVQENNGEGCMILCVKDLMILIVWADVQVVY